MSGRSRSPRRVFAPFYALLSVDGQTAYVRAPDLEPGDVLEIDGVPYIVLGRLHARSQIDRDQVCTGFRLQGKDQGLLAKVMRQYAWYPKRRELTGVSDYEPAVIRFRVVERTRELEYSVVYGVEGGPDEDPWLIDLLVRKQNGEEAVKLEEDREYVAYGTFRWSAFGTLRFNAVTVIPYEK